MDLYSINYKNIDAYSKIIHVGDIVCYGFRQCLGKSQGHLVANQQHFFRCLRPRGWKVPLSTWNLSQRTYWHCVLHQCSTSLQGLILSVIQGNRVREKVESRDRLHDIKTLPRMIFHPWRFSFIWRASSSNWKRLYEEPACPTHSFSIQGN